MLNLCKVVIIFLLSLAFGKLAYSNIQAIHISIDI